MKFLAITLFALLSQVAMAQVNGLGLDRVNRVQITCSSMQNRPESCYVGGNIIDVRLVRQQSKSPCQEGRTFWADDVAVHVTEGCRGVFEVLTSQNGGGGGGHHPWPGNPGGGGGGHHPWPGNPGGGEGLIVSCASWQQQFETCYVGSRIMDIQLVRQESDNSCIEGYSYGATSDSVWVDRGCRGTFRVIRR